MQEGRDNRRQPIAIAVLEIGGTALFRERLLDGVRLTELRGVNAKRIHVAKWTVARGLRSLGRLDEAETIQRALAAEMERDGSSDGFVYEELAEIALARHDTAGARRWAAKAYAILKDDVWLKANEERRLARLGELGGAAQSPR